jgi:hypothetical protein
MLPISFPVTIVVIKQQATVLKDLSDVSCYRYKVKFEDGTQDIFTLVEEGPELFVKAYNSGHEHYANALVNDLYELSKVEAGQFCYILPVSLGGEDVNVWMVEEEPDPDEKDCVMVSYNRGLRFQLYLGAENDGWKVRELAYELSPEEKKLAAELADAMDVMQGDVQLQISI